MNPKELLVLLGALITLVTFVGLCFMYLRGSADKGTIESQERLAKAQAAEIADLTRRVDRAEARVKSVEAENAILRRAVAHVEEIVQMQQTLEHNHAESITVLRKIQTALEGMAA